MNPSEPKFSWTTFLLSTCLLAGLLALLLAPCLEPATVVANNDDPAGIIRDYARNGWAGWWFNWFPQRWLGLPEPWIVPGWRALALLLDTAAFAKWAPALVLMVCWVASWIGGWRITRHSGATLLFALAVTLSGTIFTTVTWGLGWRALFQAWILLGLAAAWPRSSEATAGEPRQAIARWGLAGGCFGMALAEGFDVAALTFLMLGPLLLLMAYLDAASRWCRAIPRLAAALAVAACIMAHPVVSSYQTQVAEVRPATASPEGDHARWSWATQWSLPPAELLRLVIPGLTGLRNDGDPAKMYWGSIGRDPRRDTGGTGLARHNGSGDYPGLLVWLAAAWAVLRAGWEGVALRRCRAGAAESVPSLFSSDERLIIFALAGMASLSLLLSLGRHAPFYALLYELPGISSIRNPIKFLHPATLALQLLTALAAAAWARSLKNNQHQPATALHWDAAATALQHRGKTDTWTRVWNRFSWGWTIFSIITLLGVLLLRTRIVPGLVKEFGEWGPIFYAETIAETWVFLALSLLAAGLLLAKNAGCMDGPRTALFWICASTFMAGDLLRADIPWLILDKEPLLCDAPDPVLAALAQGTPPERVAFIRPGDPAFYYWHQRAFPYLGIPCLDPIQLPRTPADYAVLEAALGRDRLKLWRMTATRYLLGPANPPKEWDLREVHRFHLRTAGTAPARAEIAPEGDYALYALNTTAPRVALYAGWMAAPQEVIARQIASPTFRPDQDVWVENVTDIPAPAPRGDTSGKVTVESWTGCRIELSGTSEQPSLLVLRERFHPFWKVEVDGRPAPLLRCNLVLRGVFLAPGTHRVTLHWSPPRTSAGITALGLVSAVGSGLFCLFYRKSSAASPQDKIPPIPSSTGPKNAPSSCVDANTDLG